MATAEEKFDLFSDSLNDFLDQVPEEDKTWVAISICREAILNVAESHIHELGLVEILKDDLKQFFDYCREEDKKKQETPKGKK